MENDTLRLSDFISISFISMHADTNMHIYWIFAPSTSDSNPGALNCSLETLPADS